MADSTEIKSDKEKDIKESGLKISYETNITEEAAEPPAISVVNIEKSESHISSVDQVPVIHVDSKKKKDYTSYSKYGGSSSYTSVSAAPKFKGSYDYKKSYTGTIGPHHYTHLGPQTSHRSEHDVRGNILRHPIVLQNRPEATKVNPHLSKRSKQVMREGFELGFAYPGLRAMYDVIVILF